MDDKLKFRLVSLQIFIWFLFLFLIYKINRPNYLWSKKILKLDNYSLKDTESISNKNEIIEQINKIDNNNILWIRNTSNLNLNNKTDLDILSENLHFIKNPIILITSDGDRPVPSSYNKKVIFKILNSVKIKKWLTQNYDKTIVHKKLGYYPIGLDFHTKKWYPNNVHKVNLFNFFNTNENNRINKFEYYLKMRKKYKDRKTNKIFCDSHLTVTHPERKKMYEKLKNNKFINFLDKPLSFEEIIKKYVKHKFVISPRGNGLDCHRTWEIFLSGSIVITESSSLNDMFKKNGLPVIIISDYHKLNNITSEQLDIWWNKYYQLTDLKNIKEKFNPRYWLGLL